ncbi:SIMPL domain-containing protein [Sphingobacterium faecale]|uniref:SIMPL domain-containing protein n=1 Tax=Sphingobacterium faecale TaxID=2803775 RepID=A0ABS1R1L6_9SPHI|nr:SIMPL domain-containing protein [Sphingobacterium faecale]MBL1408563.1 SIMPL domain-containing protein [Sphingobacterium faecale]
MTRTPTPLLFLGALALIIATLFSCGNGNSESKNRIRVGGEGKIRVMPDQVTLTINASFSKPKMAEAVRETQATVDTVMLILEKFGKKNEDIKTSSISANKDYQYIGSTYKFVGFQAEQTIDFVLHDLNKFTELTAKLLETKISSISQIQFNHSKADSLLREADLIAYDDALKSANKLAYKANVQLGTLLFLSNDGLAASQGGYTSGERIDTYNKAFGGQGFKIAPEVIEFKRNIITEFGIK